MRLWLAETLTDIVYLKIAGCDLHVGTTSDSIDFRLFYSKKKGRIVHMGLTHNKAYVKRTFADSFPTWSFNPGSKAWITMHRVSKSPSAPDNPKIIQRGATGSSQLYYDKDKNYFYHNTDGEIFSLPAAAVLEIQNEIDQLQALKA